MSAEEEQPDITETEPTQDDSPEPQPETDAEKTPEFDRKFNKSSTASDVVEGLDLSDRTFFITGANAGLGFETAKALSSSGGHVIMGCRNMELAEAAKAKILKESSEAQIDILPLDLASLQSVEDCAQRYSETGWPLHTLILNAGVYNPEPRVTDDGLEATLQVNHLSHFYLAKLLTPTLRVSAPSRIVVVAAESYKAMFMPGLPDVPVNPETKQPSASKSYALSKLMNVHFASEYERRNADKGVNAYSLHPGMIRTGIDRRSPGNAAWKTFCIAFTSTPEQGAATQTYLASAPENEIKGHGGEYFYGCKPSKLSSKGKDEKFSTLAWDRSNELLDSLIEQKEKREANGGVQTDLEPIAEEKTPNETELSTEGAACESTQPDADHNIDDGQDSVDRDAKVSETQAEQAETTETSVDPESPNKSEVSGAEKAQQSNATGDSTDADNPKSTGGADFDENGVSERVNSKVESTDDSYAQRDQSAVTSKPPEGKDHDSEDFKEGAAKLADLADQMEKASVSADGGTNTADPNDTKSGDISNEVPQRISCTFKHAEDDATKTTSDVVEAVQNKTADLVEDDAVEAAEAIKNKEPLMESAVKDEIPNLDGKKSKGSSKKGRKKKKKSSEIVPGEADGQDAAENVVDNDKKSDNENSRDSEPQGSIDDDVRDSASGDHASQGQSDSDVLASQESAQSQGGAADKTDSNAGPTESESADEFTAETEKNEQTPDAGGGSKSAPGQSSEQKDEVGSESSDAAGKDDAEAGKDADSQPQSIEESQESTQSSQAKSDADNEDESTEQEAEDDAPYEFKPDLSRYETGYPRREDFVGREGTFREKLRKWHEEKTQPFPDTSGPRIDKSEIEELQDTVEETREERVTRSGYRKVEVEHRIRRN